MPHLRIIIAFTAAVLTLGLGQASARPCDSGDAACVMEPAQSKPMKLDQFMKTWKPVAASKATKKSTAKKKPRPAVEQAVSEPPAAEPAPAAEPPAQVAASPAAPPETDGVAITSFDDVNEIDAAADKVEVVAFNEVNEIDLAAPAPSVAAETTGQAVSTAQEPGENGWIGKLLLAVGGTIALAGAARFLVA